MNYQSDQKGFSLIECVIAIGLLATVVGSMISLETSVLRILQFSTEKAKAMIVLNSNVAQFEYILNTKGFNGLPKPKDTKSWPSTLNPKITGSLSITEPEVKISQIFLTALNMYYMNDETMTPDLIKSQFTLVGDALDVQIKNAPSVNAEISVSWQFGLETKKLSENLYLINNTAVEALSF